MRLPKKTSACERGSNKVLNTLSKIGLPGFVKQLDMFGSPIPTFNIEG